MQYLGFNAYTQSINNIDSTVVFMAKGCGDSPDEDFLLIAANDGKTGEQLGFTGKDLGGGLFRADLNHKNADILHCLFPFTSPVRGLKRQKSFGLGDRLGIATAGHIDLFEKNDVFPVFAQQSIRELNLTERTYKDVLDAATFAVFRQGYKRGFGADGDHLKTARDIENALSLGFTMITLDCSEHIKSGIVNGSAAPVPEYYMQKYLNKNFDIEGISLCFTEEELKSCIAIYADAVSFAADMYRRFFTGNKYNADLEISIDETASVTTPLQHFFVSNELIGAGVEFATIAPRFCGEFQKGIDYIGDAQQFEKEIKVHAAIARHFGYKLSIHSGSDKFSVFAAIGRQTRGNFHVKTAGTNWLEAMRVIAQNAPSLYREIHNFALTVFEDAKKFYHVTTDISKIPGLAALKDEELDKLFENNDARQLIHITYGHILTYKNSNGSLVFKDRIYRLLREHEDKYRAALVKHIGKHLELLN